MHFIIITQYLHDSLASILTKQIVPQPAPVLWLYAELAEASIKHVSKVYLILNTQTHTTVATAILQVDPNPNWYALQSILWRLQEQQFTCPCLILMPSV